LEFGAYLHHRFFGHGQVVSLPGQPTVRFLDGRECRVDPGDVVPLDIDTFERQLATIAKLNARLIIKVHGAEALPPDGRLWRRDERGLWGAADRDCVQNCDFSTFA